MGAKCVVKANDTNEQYNCAVRGRFRIEGIKATSPVAVGDQVLFSPPETGELGRVHKILPRKNYILRRAAIHYHKLHILCANIDQAILLFTIDQPVTSPGFADRFLVIAEAYHIPTIVIINKVDLLHTEEHFLQLDYYTQLYDNIGYTVKHVSALNPDHKTKVEEILKGKTTFIGGHSGAGKSTLINLIDPHLNIRTSEISSYTNKGRHTTTHSQMHPLSIGGYIIDSPGIKEMGLTDFQTHELSHYFPEMRAVINQCKFNDCKHINEPQCAVKAGLEDESISPIRYQSYLSMIEDIETTNAQKY